MGPFDQLTSCLMGSTRRDNYVQWVPLTSSLMGERRSEGIEEPLICPDRVVLSCPMGLK